MPAPVVKICPGNHPVSAVVRIQATPAQVSATRGPNNLPNTPPGS